MKKHGAERAAKGFTCWTQFVAMLFCQLGRADSLRDICNGLACCLGRLVHVGIAKVASRSTLSYANEGRPAALFEELFWTALALFGVGRAWAPASTSSASRTNCCRWIRPPSRYASRCFRGRSSAGAKGGVKAQCSAPITMTTCPPTCCSPRPSVATIKLGQESFRLNPGSIVTMDRGYTDYALFGHAGRW